MQILDMTVVYPLDALYALWLCRGFSVFALYVGSCDGMQPQCYVGALN